VSFEKAGGFDRIERSWRLIRHARTNREEEKKTLGSCGAMQEGGGSFSTNSFWLGVIKSQPWVFRRLEGRKRGVLFEDLAADGRLCRVCEGMAQDNLRKIIKKRKKKKGG